MRVLMSETTKPVDLKLYILMFVVNIGLFYIYIYYYTSLVLEHLATLLLCSNLYHLVWQIGDFDQNLLHYNH